MNVVSPPPRAFQQYCRFESGWSDHYGALHVAAEYAGLEIPAKFAFNGLWQHGCFGPWSQRVPSALVCNHPSSALIPFLVARTDERDCLKKNGYSNVRAISLPIVYAPDLSVQRVPRSLLVVPTHTLAGADYPDRTAFDAYANEISQISAQFDHVVVCIHPNCRKNGLWIDEFSNRGFQIVFGAQIDDRNALLRMRLLFEQFEFVTTNGWGSHIPYALAFGAKVSIYGTEPAVRVENLLKDGTWRRDVDALRKSYSVDVLTERHHFLKSFCRHPREGIADVAKGRWWVGAENKISPTEMRDLLMRLVLPMPKPAGLTALALEDTFRKEPSNVKACVGLASAALATERFIEARSLFDHALSVAPQNPTVHVGRAVALARLNELAAAEQAARSALELVPDSVEALRLLARLCRVGGRQQESVELYERILTLRPGDADARTGIAQVAPAVVTAR